MTQRKNKKLKRGKRKQSEKRKSSNGGIQEKNREKIE